MRLLILALIIHVLIIKNDLLIRLTTSILSLIVIFNFKHWSVDQMQQLLLLHT
jgi:hypothetical protein